MGDEHKGDARTGRHFDELLYDSHVLRRGFQYDLGRYAWLGHTDLRGVRSCKRPLAYRQIREAVARVSSRKTTRPEGKTLRLRSRWMLDASRLPVYWVSLPP